MSTMNMDSMTSLESNGQLLVEDCTTPIITEGSYAIVRKVGGEHSRVFRITSNSNILIEKLRFEAESALSHPFGLFEVIGKRLVPASVEDLKKRDGTDDIEMREAEVGNGSTKPPAPLVAPAAAPEGAGDAAAPAPSGPQSVTAEAIQDIKDGGGTAGDVVSKLVEGSSTFANRTSYAKSKYIRRKTRKHSDRVFILKPTIRLLTECYYRKDHDRAGHLRPDQLGQIMQYGAVHYGRKVCVFDQMLGIISAAVVDRLGGSGACVHLHRGLIAQSIPCVHAMNFTKQALTTFLPVRIASILNGFSPPPTDKKDEKPGESAEELVKKEMEDEEREGQTPMEIIKREIEDEQRAEEDRKTPLDETMTSAQQIARKAERLAKENAGLEVLLEGVDTLLIGSRSVEPISVLRVLWDKLRPAGNVVIYSPSLHGLMQAQIWLRERSAINILLTDQMHRAYQVLESSTHPMMSQMIVGGYVLSAIKVFPPKDQLT